MGMIDIPDEQACQRAASMRAEGIHIRQNTSPHAITYYITFPSGEL